MPTLWVVASISALGLGILVFLLRAEERKGRRIVLRRMRAALDLLILKVHGTCRKLLGTVNGSVARRVFHFLVNRFLRLLIAFVRGLESVLRKLQRTNQQVARTAAISEDSHLGVIKEHKSSFSLTPEEKRQKRREMLE